MRHNAADDGVGLLVINRYNALNHFLNLTGETALSGVRSAGRGGFSDNSELIKNRLRCAARLLVNNLKINHLVVFGNIGNIGGSLTRAHLFFAEIYFKIGIVSANLRGKSKRSEPDFLAVVCNVEIIAENVAVKLLVKRKSSAFTGGFEQRFAGIVNRIINAGIIKHCLKDERLNAVFLLASVCNNKLHGVDFNVIYPAEN